MEEKLDLKKVHKKLYNPPKAAEVVEVPEYKFLMIDGQGAGSESERFPKAIQALFGVSFKAKFKAKKELGRDYTVMPLEGLWWAEDMDDFIHYRKERWRWTLMIMQPEFITETMITAVTQEVVKEHEPEILSSLRLECFTEGMAAQMMHIGPFSEEHQNIMKLHDLITAKGGKFDGQVQKHHEIYLSDFRKVDPQKMRTIIRQPFIV